MTAAVVAVAHVPFQRILYRNGYAPTQNDRPDRIRRTMDMEEGNGNRRVKISDRNVEGWPERTEKSSLERRISAGQNSRTCNR